VMAPHNAIELVNMGTQRFHRVRRRQKASSAAASAVDCRRRPSGGPAGRGAVACVPLRKGAAGGYALADDGEGEMHADA
jgi:hypothetical protein